MSPLAALASAATLGIADFNGGRAGQRTPAPSVTVGIEAVRLAHAALGDLAAALRLGWTEGSPAVTTSVIGATTPMGYPAS